MVYEKVTPSHPDKLADRISGALVDLAYTLSERPKIAVEVLIGHGEATVVIETSEAITEKDVVGIVHRICEDDTMKVNARIVPQDVLLRTNQEESVRCGDNGIFKGTIVTEEQMLLTAFAKFLYNKYAFDGKYVIAEGDLPDVLPFTIVPHTKQNTVKVRNYILRICHSNVSQEEIESALLEFVRTYSCDKVINLYPVINPLGAWTGGTDVDTGATNRKLGSDMGDSVTGGGLHGKDLSKADVTLNVLCFMQAQTLDGKKSVVSSCSIGDDYVELYANNHLLRRVSFAEAVEEAKHYIDSIGGFEELAKWGLLR